MSQIKQLQPKEGVTLLSYLLPKVEYSFIRVERWGQGNFLFGRPKYIGEINLNEQLPEGNLQLLGIATEIPEEVWQTLLPTFVCAPFRNRYYDYSNDNGDLITSATKSGMSFLEANEVYSVNPYPFPGCECSSNANKDVTDKCETDNARWSKAEANTGTWIILMKQND